MKRRPRFEYGSTSSFEASLPSRAWNPIDETVGGVRVAAAGMPASYGVRRDALTELTLRIRETEWAAFLNLIIFGQSAASFLWFPDALEAASYSVYLESPAMGQRFTVTRSGEYPRVFEATIVLRGVGIAIPWQPYF